MSYAKMLAFVLFCALVGGVVLVFFLAFVVGFFKETFDRKGKR